MISLESLCSRFLNFFFFSLLGLPYSFELSQTSLVRAVVRECGAHLIVIRYWILCVCTFCFL